MIITMDNLVGEDGFLIVKHSVLNGNSYDIGAHVEDALSYQKHLGDRKAVPCFEGDLLQVAGTGEVVLTHQNFVPLTQKRFRMLYGNGLAISLSEVLDRVGEYKQRNPDQKLVLCFEPKPITTDETLDETVKQLKEHNIQDAYFDTFFAGRLSALGKAFSNHRLTLPRSLHIIGNAGEAQLHLERTQPEDYDVVTVPSGMSFGFVGNDSIYGAVGSVDKLEWAAAHPEVRGAYVRLKEGSGVRGELTKLWNSVTNTRRLRGTNLCLYET